jgi:hypothetical protein
LFANGRCLAIIHSDTPTKEGYLNCYKKLKKIDSDEEIILASDEEKEIASMKACHAAANFFGATAGVVVGTLGTIFSFMHRREGGSFSTGMKTTALVAITTDLFATVVLHRLANVKETACEYTLVRLVRLRNKIDEINSILASYQGKNLTQRMQIKIKQLKDAKLGLRRIIDVHERIFKNSEPLCSSVHFSQEGFPHEYNPAVVHLTTSATKKIHADIRQLKDQGHKISEDS